MPRVAIHFGTPRQEELEQVSVSDMRRYLAEGHFPAGSMGPKVEAALRFLDAGGRRVIITSLDTAVPALKGETGTHIVPDHIMAQPAQPALERPARNGLLQRVA